MDGLVVSRSESRVRYSPFVKQMHHLRAEVFGGRLNWDVACVDGQERDQFDALDPTYILVRGRSGEVEASCRLLRTTGSYMLRDLWPGLLNGATAPEDDQVWEVSRFWTMPAEASAGGLGAIHRTTQALLIYLLAVGLSNNLNRIVAVTEVRFERVLRRSGLDFQRFGGRPVRIGNTRAVAGWTDVTVDNLCGLVRRYEQLPVNPAPAIERGQDEAA